MSTAPEKRDEELLGEHLAGKPGAFDELVGRYADELFGFLLRYVGNAAQAEDLLQEAFLQVHLSAATFDLERPFRPWVYTIAANKARDFLRSRGRRTEQSLDAGGTGDGGPTPAAMLPADVEHIGAALDEAELRGIVHELVGRMPEHLRMILVLGYFQQLPYAEIAEVLDIPVGTVKSRLHSAVRHFARLWEDHANRRDDRNA